MFAIIFSLVKASIINTAALLSHNKFKLAPAFEISPKERVKVSTVNNNSTNLGKCSPRVATGGVSCCCGMGRHTWKNQIQNRVLPAVRAFNPDLILLSAGFDAGKHDVGNMNLVDETKPRIGMDLTVEDYTWLTDRINAVANLCCDGKVVSVLEGGYGRWTKKRVGNTTEFVIDRTLLADNCSAHIRAMVGNYFDD